jgi:tetratricopeptide (TPR) repeat protein
MVLRAVAAVAVSCLIGTGAFGQDGAGPFETTSLIGVKLYGLADDGSIAKAQAALAGAPNDAGLALKVSLAQAGRRQYVEAVAMDTEALKANPKSAPLYLERGHRELGLRKFAAAQKDLEKAAELDPTVLVEWYHLGLAHYFQGQFKEAAAALAKARALAKSDDDLIDCSAWLYNSYSRAGMKAQADEVLARITPAVKNTEPHLAFYLKLLRFYQGKLKAEDIVPPPPAPGDLEGALSFTTVSYGVGNYELVHGRKAVAKGLFEGVVKGETWNAWGFVGSEVELK